MADLSDVEKALVDAIIAHIYPSGLQGPSLVGEMVRIYRGWPVAAGLSADLAAGTMNISVFSDPNATHETTRYPRIWRETTPADPTLTVSVVAGVATFGGSGGVGQNAGILVDGAGYTVGVGADDNPQTVASALAAQIPGATALGSSVSVPGGVIESARVEGSAAVTMETRRQEQDITVSIWTADPLARDQLAGLVDAGLSTIDWLTLSDGTSARLLYRETAEIDSAENADLYRRDLKYRAEYPTIIAATVPAMLFGLTRVTAGQAALSSVPDLRRLVSLPRLGAIRFDAWYDPTNEIDRECASCLSSPDWYNRLPPNAVIAADGTVSWPAADQTTIDAEIAAALTAGLSFWAFDSYPQGGLSRALSLYLSSVRRGALQFCMLGQSSNWADPASPNGYSATLGHDIEMMAETGYVRLLGDRPLYLVLDASAAQLASLPPGGISAAIATLRRLATEQGVGDPYVVWLSGAALGDYDNVPSAIAAGADAAASYACPRLNGAPQPYASLATAATADWAARAARGYPFIPTAMTGWDQRPLIARPQAFYPISADLTVENYYEPGSNREVANHVAALTASIVAAPAGCPAQIGLIYAWNELAEGGWLMPTAGAGISDTSKVDTVGLAVADMRRSLMRGNGLTS